MSSQYPAHYHYDSYEYATVRSDGNLTAETRLDPEENLGSTTAVIVIIAIVFAFAVFLTVYLVRCGANLTTRCGFRNRSASVASEHEIAIGYDSQPMTDKPPSYEDVKVQDKKELPSYKHAVQLAPVHLYKLNPQTAIIDGCTMQTVTLQELPISSYQPAYLPHSSPRLTQHRRQSSQFSGQLYIVSEDYENT